MFYCSSGGSDPLKMSKSGILRGIITEKLSTAAREILAVVERTVADYEEEAAGFRREIELLQAKESTGGESKRKRPANLRQNPETISKRIQKASTEPKHAPSRSHSSRAQTGMKKNVKNVKVPQPRTHVDIKVRLLENPEIDVLNSVVMRRIPTMVLKCPLNLLEPAFLDLLMFSYPQLAAGEPFDILKMKRSKKSKKLRPLRLKTLTPEEISAAGNPMLYIRLRRTPVKTDVGEALITESTSADPPVLNNNETGSQMSLALGSDGLDEKIQPIIWMTQEQEVAESHMDSVEPQIHLDEGVTSDRPEEEERSATDAAGAPVLTGKPESETSSVGNFQPISSSSEPDSSSTDTDHTSDEEAGCAQDAGRPTEGRTSRVTCRVCGKLFRQLGSLLSHVWDHVDEPDAVCGVCGERLGSAATLRSHVTRHTRGFHLGRLGKDPASGAGLQQGPWFECELCSRPFSSMAALRRHSWVHQDGTPVRCHFCLKSFALQADFLVHRRLNASCRGHGCRLCDKAYLSEAMLREHEKTHASGPRTLGTGTDTSWACGLCGASFESGEALEAHMSDHPVDRHVAENPVVRPWLCTICGQVSEGQEALEVHMRSHGEEGHPEPGGENTEERPHCSWSE